MEPSFDQITKERLEAWRKELDELGNVTPILLVAVGHGPRRGQMHVQVPEGPYFDYAATIAFLEQATKMLRAHLAQGGNRGPQPR